MDYNSAQVPDWFRFLRQRGSVQRRLPFFFYSFQVLKHHTAGSKSCKNTCGFQQCSAVQDVAGKIGYVAFASVLVTAYFTVLRQLGCTACRLLLPHSLLSAAVQNRLTAVLCHCKNTCGTLLLVEV